MSHLLYLMFWCDGDVMESLEFGGSFWELNTALVGTNIWIIYFYYWLLLSVENNHAFRKLQLSSTGQDKMRRLQASPRYLECCWLCQSWPSLLAGCLPNSSTLPSCELTQLPRSFLRGTCLEFQKNLVYIFLTQHISLISIEKQLSSASTNA